MDNNIKCEHKNPEGETKQEKKLRRKEGKGRQRESFEHNEKRQKHTSHNGRGEMKTKQKTRAI